MLKFWQAALGMGGISVVVAFVFLSLYRDWLRLGVFAPLTKKQTFTVMMTFLVLSFIAFLSILIVRVLEGDPKVREEVVTQLELRGTLDIRDPTVDKSEVSIGLLWGIEDDRSYYWTDGVMSGNDFRVTITAAQPPDDALMSISAVESSTPGAQELLRLGVASLIAYRDQNGSELFDRGDELVGGCPTHVVTFRDGPLPSSLQWNIFAGFSLAEAIPPEGIRSVGDFDVLRSVQSATRVIVVVPQSRDEIRFPNWT